MTVSYTEQIKLLLKLIQWSVELPRQKNYKFLNELRPRELEIILECPIFAFNQVSNSYWLGKVFFYGFSCDAIE